MKTKICIKCKEEKNIYEFRIVNNKYINTCNKCINKMARERYLKNKVKENPLYIQIKEEKDELENNNLRRCKKCGKIKPLSEFHKNGKYYRTNCIECKNTYEKEQYQRNRERVLARNKIYDKEHSEEKRKYRENRAEEIAKYNHDYYNENLDKIKKYRAENKDKIKAQSRRYRLKHKEHLIELRKAFYKNNPHYARDYDKRKIAEDDLYRFRKLVRNMIKASFTRKGLRKGRSTQNIVGCDYKFLQEYLLKTFKDNYGYEWDRIETVHIDHIIPLATATTEEEIIKLCHYTNLQLLKAKDNIEKSDRLDWNIEKK